MKIAMIGDLHFRSTVPEARLDDYLDNQDKLIKFLKKISEDHTIICSGDVVHRARERQDALGFTNYLIDTLPYMWGILGNHDLLDHSFSQLNKTTMGTLINASSYGLLSADTVLELERGVYAYGFSYGVEIQHNKVYKDNTNIAVYHGMVMEEPNDFFDGHIALDLLKEFPEYDIILTGDNHKGFVVEHEGRILINPGSLKRDTADQIDHVPYVYTYDTITKKLDKIPVPIENDIISRDHLEAKKERDARIEALSEKFGEVRTINLDYFDNVINFMKQTKVEDWTQDRVKEWME